VSRGTLALERVAIGLASLALSVGLIAVLSGFFAGRDQAGVSAPALVPGQSFPDQGHRVLARDRADPRYDSDPPTSGPHHAAPVRRDGTPLSDDQLLTALAAGDLVVAYGGRTPPAGLPALVRREAAPFSPALAAAGQAILLVPRPATRGIIALAWAHMLRTTRSDDPVLRDFLNYWLGRGAP